MRKTKTRSRNIEVTIRLTPSQIKEAYRQVCEAEADNDWIYEPEVVAEVVSRAKSTRKELASGKTKNWDEFRKELGV